MTLGTPQPRATPLVAAPLRPWTIALGGVLLAVVATLLVLSRVPGDPRALPLVVVTVAFFVTETVSLHVEFRRQTYLWSVSELALAIALVEVGGLWAAVARAIGLGLSLAYQHYSPAKAVYNVAVAVVEVA